MSLLHQLVPHDSDRVTEKAKPSVTEIKRVTKKVAAISVTKKSGRPKTDDALSQAERARAYRQRKKEAS